MDGIVFSSDYLTNFLFSGLMDTVMLGWQDLCYIILGLFFTYRFVFGLIKFLIAGADQGMSKTSDDIVWKASATHITIFAAFALIIIIKTPVIAQYCISVANSSANKISSVAKEHIVKTGTVSPPLITKKVAESVIGAHEVTDCVVLNSYREIFSLASDEDINSVVIQYSSDILNAFGAVDAYVGTMNSNSAYKIFNIPGGAFEFTTQTQTGVSSSFLNNFREVENRGDITYSLRFFGGSNINANNSLCGQWEWTWKSGDELNYNSATKHYSIKTNSSNSAIMARKTAMQAMVNVIKNLYLERFNHFLDAHQDRFANGPICQSETIGCDVPGGAIRTYSSGKWDRAIFNEQVNIAAITSKFYSNLQKGKESAQEISDSDSKNRLENSPDDWIYLSAYVLDIQKETQNGAVSFTPPVVRTPDYKGLVAEAKTNPGLVFNSSGDIDNSSSKNWKGWLDYGIYWKTKIRDQLMSARAGQDTLDSVVASLKKLDGDEVSSDIIIDATKSVIGIASNTENGFVVKMNTIGHFLIESGTYMFGAGAILEVGGIVSDVADSAGDIFRYAGIGILIAGGWLCVVLPFLLFWNYLSAVLGWVMAIFRYMLALPLYAVIAVFSIAEYTISEILKNMMMMTIQIIAAPSIITISFLFSVVFIDFAVSYVSSAVMIFYITLLTGSTIIDAVISLFMLVLFAWGIWQIVLQLGSIISGSWITIFSLMNGNYERDEIGKVGDAVNHVQQMLAPAQKNGSAKTGLGEAGKKFAGRRGTSNALKNK